MWPFSNKPKDLSALPAMDSEDSKWRIAQGSHDETPLIVRINDSAKEWLGHKGLGIRLGFAIPLNDPVPGGLPEPDENRALQQVEDVIVQEVQSTVTGLFVLVLTTGMMKEFVFYIAPGADIATLHQQIQNRVSSHEVQCLAELDPKWKSYTDFGGL